MGMSSQTIVTIVLGLVEIISFSIMSRLLTQEDFGYFAAITAITAVFSSFSETGIGSAIVQQKELNKRYVDNAFTISLLFGGFIAFLLLGLSGSLSQFVADKSMKMPLMLMSGTLLLNCLTSVNVSLMHRKMQFLRMGSVNLISLVITTCVAIWLAWKGHGYYAIITKAVLGSVITYVLSLVLCNTRFSIALDRDTFKKIFSFSGWLMASALFRNLAHQIDRLMMPRLLSINALGAYNRPKDFIESISTRLNGIFDSALFPVLSGVQDKHDVLQSAFRRSLSLMNVFALLLTLTFFFNSRLIIRIFFGEQWLDLNGIMMVVSCSLLFNIDGRLADCFLRSLAMTKEQFYFRIFETFLKLIGVLIGYKWGVLGVAVSIVITNFITKMAKILYVSHALDIRYRECIRIIVTSWRFSIIIILLCGMAMHFLPNSWFGDVSLAFIYTISVSVIFLLFPSLVSEQYRNEVYVKLISFLQRKRD